MCRLYGLQATHPTRSACGLLDTQNAMIQQSREDARGLSNPHGWGMGHVTAGTTSCFRQVGPASENAEYREEALKTEGTTVLAHVRRATVGDPSHANTHPFRHGPALLIHNGRVPAFEAVRPHLLDALSDERRRYIRGTTDSEHVLALLLQLRDEHPDAPLHEVTRTALQHVQSWGAAEAPDAEPHPTDADTQSHSHDELEGILALNLLWTDGVTLAGSRLNRTLWICEWSHVRACPLCGEDHAAPPEGADYRATVLASERITDEDWTEIPNGSVFSTINDGTLHLESLDA
jgi:glutamine amidotransferase